MQGGLLFIQPLRDKKCVTMMDPFRLKYGSLASLLLDLVCVPATLAALGEFWRCRVVTLNPFSMAMLKLHCLVWCVAGGLMSVVLNLPFSVCTWISAAVVIVFTLLGGFHSVAYTEIIQLLLIFSGLVRFSFDSIPNTSRASFYIKMKFLQP